MLGVRVKSSLSFQILLHLGVYLLVFFVVVELATMLFKLMVFPFPLRNVLLELLLLSGLTALESLRIFFAWKGNLTETSLNVLLALALSGPGALATLFFLLWQTYILRVEAILCVVVLVMQGLHAIFSVVAAISFYTSTSSS